MFRSGASIGLLSKELAGLNRGIGKKSSISMAQACQGCNEGNKESTSKGMARVSAMAWRGY